MACISVGPKNPFIKRYVPVSRPTNMLCLHSFFPIFSSNVIWLLAYFSSILKTIWSFVYKYAPTDICCDGTEEVVQDFNLVLGASSNILQSSAILIFFHIFPLN